jgi:hypothetical protein
MILRVVLLVAILALDIRPATAEDITLADGTIYKGATILQHDAATATILDDDGGAAVPIAKLPADIQKRLSYDPAAAQKLLAAQQAAQTQSQLLAAKTRLLDSAALKVWGEVRQVRPDGFVADMKTVDKCAPLRPVTQTTAVQSLPAGLGEGDVVQTTVTGYVRAKIALGPVFIETDITGVVDKVHWRGIVWPVGTYSYVTDDGHHVTIPAYTTSPDRAYPVLAQAAP